VAASSKDGDAVANTLPSGDAPRAAPALVVSGDQYKVQERLGGGGMGDVYRAVDRKLDRLVALKILRSSGPALAQSLMAEARAQALVEHANICKVYGMGELDDGRAFIAMQYADAGTLRDVARRMTREQVVRALRDAARALHEAHRQGLVHRDVKPANILVEEGADGFHPLVSDFGLARVADEPTMTETGATKGTPAYMAPEQARGDVRHVDRRSDVYGMGVTMFELLTGKLPFDAASTNEMIAKVLHEEPRRLRAVDATIPVDLETITLKCMEKDPSRRYQSAQALADDLQAWLDGNPIAARSASIYYRVAKRARKHRTVLALATIAVVAAAALPLHELRSRRLAQEQATWAEAFGAEAERNDAVSRYASLLPLHDPSPELALIADDLRRLDARLQLLGRVAEGPGRYALGRGYLAIDRPDDAKRELERAWQTGFHTPEVAYALGLTESELYRRGLLELERVDDKSRRDQLRARLQRRHRDAALAQLKAATGLSWAVPSFVEALIARHEQRWADALDKAHLAQARVPWLHEAFTLEGDVHVDRARAEWDQADGKPALDELAHAGIAYGRALAIARSAAAALRGDCHRQAETALLLQERQRSPRDTVAATIVACDRLLVAQPADGQGYTEKARAVASLAIYEDEHGIASSGDWQEVSRIGQLALTATTNRPLVLATLSYIDRLHGRSLFQHDHDPRPILVEAIAHAEALLSLEPRSFEALENLAIARMGIGQWEGAHGLDAQPSFAAAIAAGERARSLGSNEASAEEDIGMAYFYRGSWLYLTGGDPANDLRQAIAHLERSNRNRYTVQLNLCASAVQLAEYYANSEQSPLESLERASLECRRAYDMQPELKLNALNAGIIVSTQATWRLEHGGNPETALAEGRQWFERALKIDAGYAAALTALGDLELTAARWALQSGTSPLAALQAARVALEASAKEDRNDAVNECALAALYRWRAEWQWKTRAALEPEVVRGIAHAQAALAINPRLGYAAMLEGQLLAYRARATNGDARVAAWRAARVTLERALQMDPSLADDVRPFLDEASATRPR
jgi:serine/threonine-protein kinase